MPTQIQNVNHLSVKEVSERLGISEFYIRQMLKAYEGEAALVELGRRQAPPTGLPCVEYTVGNRTGKFIPESAVVAYGEKRKSSGRGATSADGRVWMKIRLSLEEQVTIKELLPEAGATMVSGSNYNKKYQSERRAKRKAAAAAQPQ